MQALLRLPQATRPPGPALLGAVLGLAALTALLLLLQELSRARQDLATLLVVAAMWLVFVGAASIAQRLTVRLGTWLAVLGGGWLQLVAARVIPFRTDDHLRYAWDGRVQAAGISPYRYRPGAQELAGLRDAWLFPDGVTPRLNHPGDRTIYPPVAQIWFWLVEVMPGGPGQGRALQAGAVLLAVATSVLLVIVLRRSGGDPRRVVWWAWCPVVVLEAGGNAHIDILGSLLVVAVIGLAVTGRWARAGVLLGLAVATKVLPGLIAVGVPPRRSVRVGLATLSALAAVYLPHLWAVGGDVTGFLGGYLGEEGRDHFSVLRFVLSDGLGLGLLVRPVGVLVLMVTALLAWWWSATEESAARAERRSARPWLSAAVMVGVTFVVLTPPYPWYGLLLVPLVALGASRVWLWVCAAMYLVYSAEALGRAYGGTRVVGYGSAALVVAATYGVRAWVRRRRGSAAVPDRGR